MHRKRARGGFGGFWKSQLVELSWVLPRKKTVGLRRSQASGLVTGAARDGGRWKSQNRKNVYLSPYVEEPLNSKIIKSFVPEFRSRKCFRVLRFLCFLLYIYEHYMSISHIRIWLWNIYQKVHTHLIKDVGLFNRAGYDTWSILKRSLTGLNSEFSFTELERE